MKKIIANFKMNQTVSDTKEYLMSFISKYDEKHELVLAFPYTSLYLAKFLMEGKNIKLAAQNMSSEEQGAFTGEISASMLKSAGASAVIVGHGEVRSKFRETNKIVSKKVQLALKNSLEVILCIGENKTEKVADKTEEVLKFQLEEGLRGLYENELENITIAYEPLWTIGSENALTNKEIENVVDMIRKIITELFSEKAAEDIKIVYGGGLNSKNIFTINKCKNLDGFMLSSLALDPKNFLQTLSSLND